MSYRPITDSWLLARPKVKYYGSFPSGFLERARALLGITIYDPVLHVCGGMVRSYPFFGFGPNDKTLDLDLELQPDYYQNAALPFPPFSRLVIDSYFDDTPGGPYERQDTRVEVGWPAILIDRPYTDADHLHYAPGREGVPLVELNLLLRNGLTAVRDGGRVGILDYLLPNPPKTGCKFVAKVGVSCGYNNRERVYSVWEKRP